MSSSQTILQLCTKHRDRESPKQTKKRVFKRCLPFGVDDDDDGDDDAAA